MIQRQRVKENSPYLPSVGDSISYEGRKDKRQNFEKNADSEMPGVLLLFSNGENLQTITVRLAHVAYKEVSSGTTHGKAQYIRATGSRN